MATWAKEEIVLPGGERVSAQMPIIVSASRSTDIPAFYSDWFVERFSGGNGYVKWFNPFNNVKCFSHDTEMMKFVGTRFVPGDPLFGVLDRWEPGDHRKDKGQREACGCIMSKDIGEYNTCPHVETITGK